MWIRRQLYSLTVSAKSDLVRLRHSGPRFAWLRLTLRQKKDRCVPRLAASVWKHHGLQRRLAEAAACGRS